MFLLLRLWLAGYQILSWLVIRMLAIDLISSVLLFIAIFAALFAVYFTATAATNATIATWIEASGTTNVFNYDSFSWTGDMAAVVDRTIVDSGRTTAQHFISLK